MALEHIDRNHFLRVLVSAFERAQGRKPSKEELAVLSAMLDNPSPEFAEALSVVTDELDLEISIIGGEASFRLVPKEGNGSDQMSFAS